MGIGTSLGAYFDDDFHHAAAKWDNKYDDNEYDADETSQKIQSQSARISRVSDQTTDPNDMTGMFDGTYNFTPGKTNLKYHSPEELQDYFSKVEKGNTLKSVPDVEDRRDENYRGAWHDDGSFAWDRMPPVFGNIATDVGNQLWGIPQIPEAPESPLSDALGREDIKIEPKIGRSPLERGIDDIQEAFNVFGVGKGESWADKLTAPDSFSSGIKLPQPDAEGNLNVNPWVTITPGNINQAVNIGMGVGPLSFKGVKALTFDKSAVYKAVDMEMNGAHPDDIWKETGTARGADGQWRQEIDDSKAGIDEYWHERPPLKAPDIDPEDPYKQIPFNPNEGFVTAKLPEVIDHPELYKAYPHLKDVDAVYDPNLRHAGAYYEASNNRIVVGPSTVDDYGSWMHEIQHAIQDYEGHAKGGAVAPPNKVYSLKYSRDVEALRKPFNDLQEDLFNNPSKLRSKEFYDLYDKARAAINYHDNVYIPGAWRAGQDNYMRLAGEAEARNTETRLNLTDKERRNIPPTATEDVDRANQVAVTAPAWGTAYGVIDPITRQYIK